MTFIGIDYGRRQVGVAISDGDLAQGIGEYNTKEALTQLTLLCQKEHATLVVVGLPEGYVKTYAKSFGENLAKSAKINVVYWDETLTSRVASEQLAQGDYRRKSKHTKVHRVAAALILQSYLDETKKTSR